MRTELVLRSRVLGGPLRRVLFRLRMYLERFFERRRFAISSDPPKIAIREHPRVANRYDLERILGEGGMGRVWLAYDSQERCHVALKEMRIGTDNPGAKSAQGERGVEIAQAISGTSIDAAFRREFFTMNALRHPNTLRVFDYGMMPRGDRYITMEVVDGVDLTTVIQQGELGLTTIYRYLIQLAQVLGFIHSRLFVHCDIKSDNIRIASNGQVKLMDFGLMHQLGTPSGGMLKGTPDYMAPEIPQGGVIDARTDLYSLGVLAFEMLTGRKPFHGTTLTQLIGQHARSPVPALSEIRPKTPPDLERIVQTLLAKDPNQRFENAGALVRALSDASGIGVEDEAYGIRASYIQASDLVGREQEQAGLRDAFAGVSAGRGKSMFIAAPAGVGKSRLLQEFRLMVKLADVPFYLGQCRQDGLAPLAPLVEALTPVLLAAPRPILELHGPILARVFTQLTEYGIAPASPGQSPAADKIATFEALRIALKAAVDKQMFVVCIEDLHWADSGTVEYMNIAIRALANTPSMILGTFRSDEVDRFSTIYKTIDEGVSALLALQALSEDATSTLLKRMLGDAQLGDSFASKLYSVTLGNAFFVTETIRTLMDTQVLALCDGRWVVATENVDFPTSIADAVERRHKTLPDDLQSFAWTLAPIGRFLDVDIVQDVLQSSETAVFELLDKLVERQFVERRRDNYFFTHDTVRAALYDTLNAERKTNLHTQIGDALLHNKKSRDNDFLIGYHLARGVDASRAVPHLRTAGERALERRLLLEGLQLLSQTADILEQTSPAKESELVELWDKLIDVGYAAHPPTCAKYSEKLSEKVEARLDPNATQRFYRELERTQSGFGAERKLRKIWRDQRLDWSSSDPMHLVPKLAGYRNAQAYCLGVLGMPAQAQELNARLLQHHSAETPIRAVIESSKAAGFVHQGRWKSLTDLVGRANQILEKHREQVGELPSRFFWVHALNYYWLQLGGALAGLAEEEHLFQKGNALASAKGFEDVLFFLSLTRVYRAAVCADEPSLTTAFGAASDTVRRMGNPPLFESRLGWLLPDFYITRREREKAEAAVQKLSALADPWMQRYATVGRAALDIEFADVATGRASLDKSRAVLTEVPSFARHSQIESLTARQYAREGNMELAVQHAKTAIRIATDPETANLLDQIIAKRALADVEFGDAATVAAHDAVAAARDTAHQVQLGLALLSLAQRLLKDDRAGSARALREAEEIFEKSGTSSLLNRCRDFSLKSAGVR